MIELTDKTFGIVANSSGPFIVGFYAEYCGSCKVTHKVLREIQDHIDCRIGLVDGGKCLGLAKQYKISAVPTIILFWDGIETERITGQVKQQVIESLLE